MNIALLGYGKMGKAIEEYCQNHTNHNIVLKIGSSNQDELTIENLQKADVAIDFSTPEIAVKHITISFQANIPIVSGSTGWLEQYETIKKECKTRNQTFFYASNFSVGVHLFWQIVNKASQLLNPHKDFSCTIDETHHIHKKDAPSGTAITTAENIINNLDRYENWQLNQSKNSNTIPIFAHRENEVPGTHLVTFDSAIDTIKLEHIAKSRLGFVKGAILAAEFIQHKKGIFSMNDLLQQ